MENILIILILVAIVACIILYFIRSKKAGKKCIGCPYGGECKSKGKCNCNNEKE